MLEKNSHERDTNICFIEEPHIYRIDGDSDYLSVTTWNHIHFAKFNADNIIASNIYAENLPSLLFIFNINTEKLERKILNHDILKDNYIMSLDII